MDFLKYHVDSSKLRDIDPANDCLRYVADRFELNMEQRYWLAFLYSTCYCGPTVFYMYNEFPDFEHVNVPRLERWWKANKSKLVFQTDRLRIKTSDKFVETFESYSAQVLSNANTQEEFFTRLRTPYAKVTYMEAFNAVTSVANVGRFTAFIWLEMVHVLTNFKCEPTGIDWKNADNCRKGLCYAYGKPDTHDSALLDAWMSNLVEKVAKTKCEHRSIYNIETTLCAFKKHVHGKRYVGYYIERQLKELDKMAANVKEGVCWQVLYDFRKETYKHVER